MSARAPLLVGGQWPQAPEGSCRSLRITWTLFRGRNQKQPRWPLLSQELLGTVHRTSASGAPGQQTWSFKNTIHPVILESVYQTVLRQAHETGHSTQNGIFRDVLKEKKKKP